MMSAAKDLEGVLAEVAVRPGSGTHGGNPVDFATSVHSVAFVKEYSFNDRSEPVN